MMVPAFAPGPGPRPLSTESAARLRDAIRRHTTGAADDAHLRDAVTVVVIEARERDMRPEELLPAFKALLDALPELQATPGNVDESRLRERLVTLCIKAYYGA